MGALALDASVAIGFLEPTDAHHDRAVSELRRRSDAQLIMAASAYSETLVRPLALGLGDRVEAFVDGLRIEIVPADREIARTAAQLRAANGGLRLPDALVVATAQLRDAELLTFDERLRQL
ncbi:MAG TPA: PIN domain-containing protein [Solirubrobacterales bacterium]|nr:PIN domain-containing protein [Solirubrobacterales bacterium]